MSDAFHSDELALLTAIRAEPSDDTPRLVYADWLDEHERPDRAEFIRVQCELGNLPEPDMTAIITGAPTHADYPTGRCAHCFALPHPCQYHALRSRAQELLSGLFPNMAGYKLTLEETEDSATATVRRGFVETVVDTAEGWVARADGILAEHPVMAVHLTTWPHMLMDCRTEGEGAQTFLRLEGRERWHLSESLPGLAKEGPWYQLRDLLIAEWPTVKDWNLSAPPPSGDAGMTLMLQFGDTRMSVAETVARLRASEQRRESLPHRILRGIRRLFEAD